MATEVIGKCAICGKPTVWDYELGDNIQCMDCWDDLAGHDNELAANQRRYRQEHKEEIAAYRNTRQIITKENEDGTAKYCQGTLFLGKTGGTKPERIYLLLE